MHIQQSSCGHLASRQCLQLAVSTINRRGLLDQARQKIQSLNTRTLLEGLLAKPPQQACPNPWHQRAQQCWLLQVHLVMSDVAGEGWKPDCDTHTLGVTVSMWRSMGTGYGTRDLIKLAAPCMYPRSSTQLRRAMDDKWTNRKTQLSSVRGSEVRNKPDRGSQDKHVKQLPASML